MCEGFELVVDRWWAREGFVEDLVGKAELTWESVGVVGP